MTSLLRSGLTLALTALVAIGCGDGKKDPNAKGEKKTSITEKGSDTMVLIAQKWAEEFQKKNPNVNVQVSGGGSGTGIAALINGTTDIANASRPMKEDERAKVREKFGNDVVEIPVALDAIAIYVSSDNQVDSLTMEQLAGIFSGKITNWKEVGGKDANIILYGRENSSGTYEYFKEHVLDKGDFAASTQTLTGTAAIVNAVGKDPNGIGYGGAAYEKGGIKHVRLVGSAGAAIAPNKETVTNGTYPLARKLYFYLPQQPTGATKEYVDFVLSPEGQAFTTQMEYFPLQ